MPLRKTTTLFLIAALWWSNLSAQETLKFSLEQAIDYALSNNIDMKNAQLAHESSDYEIGEILSIGLPQVSASVNLTSNVVVPKSPVPAEFFGGEPGEFAFVAFSPQASRQPERYP